MAESVRVRNLTKSFGENRVVDDVSVDIEPGELFFLLGPSGCGKTTLLRCIAGFYAPESGTIAIGERDITRLPPHERDTGMVFQSYALWPHMTVAENVGFGLEMRKVSDLERAKRIAEALEMVKMADRAKSRPNELSGGQQQRVALARALVIRPRCLLLDEPLSNLDAKLRLEMRTEIRRICKQAGLTTIYVTHDQKEALSIADRLAVLDRGKIRQCGKPQEVYRRPNSQFVAGFIGETNLVVGRIHRVSAGLCEVATPIGIIRSAQPPAEPVAEGAPVTLSIRPEIIRLGAPPAGAANVFDAGVHDTVYLGEIAQQHVRIGPAEWKAFEMNPTVVALDETVAKTKVWFAPEDAVVLTK